MADLSNKHTKILIGFAIGIAILVAKIFYIQIINDKYKKDAINNSIVYETIYPPRGVIYDRNGHVLVDNKVVYDILVTPREIRQFDTLSLARVLDIDTAYIKERLDYYKRFRSRIGFQTLTFLSKVDQETYLRFAEKQYRFPGFKGQVKMRRTYPFNAGGNLLGYVAEADADLIKKNKGYKSGDLVGKTGLESAREDDLKGEKGYRIFLRDSKNRVLTSYNNGADDKEAVPGKNITTTIDAYLQQYGQELMKNKVGSVVAIEPSTGEILAMVSSPGIDVEVLGDIGKYYRELASDPNKPMFNRTVQASYPPGSVFKLINGLIGMEEEVLQPRMTYPCQNGYMYTSTRKLGCHSHRSPINLNEAIMMSCNSYFCYVFKDILEHYGDTKASFDAWRDYVTSFGFGSKLGSDFPSELGGNIPSSDYYDRAYGKGHWKYSTVISLSIGQGEIGATPLQIANLSATVANRGWYITPHIVKDSEGVTIDPKYHEKNHTKIDPDLFEKVITGMWMAVNTKPGDGGTATVGAVPGLDICGKTGTAQNPHGDDNSVFICFAPRENPQIAIAAYVENAGFGATWACPIASLMVEKYLNGEISEDRKWMEKRVLNTDLIHKHGESK